MKVANVDHDMLLLAHLFWLYGRDEHAAAARGVGLDEEACVDPLDAHAMADILATGDLPVLVLHPDTPNLTAVASEYAREGAAVLVHMLCPDICSQPLWHLVSSDHPGYFATLCLVERKRAPFLGANAQEAIDGPLVVIPTRCPRWRGSWDRLLPD